MSENLLLVHEITQCITVPADARHATGEFP